MFFEGSLQEGISTAVGQQKLVLCFVTDENEEAQTWENEFLTDDSLSDLIKNQAIALRLKAGSEEAGYLAQIFPLPQTPTVVIMKHGELKEYITPRTSKEDFIHRVQTAFSATAPKPAPSSTSQASTAAAASSSSNPPDASPASPSAEPQQSDSVRRILADRAAKLQAQKEEAERKAKEERARASERARAEAEAGADSQAARSHRQAELVRARKQKEREERQRILRRIEDDREERRARAAEREKLRSEEQRVGDVAASLVSAPESRIPSTTRPGAMAYVQARLFDGSTVRARFKTDATVVDVRRWLDENRTDGNAPYKLKQVLSPLPNRTIDDTEESRPLGELGLAPSSTLVLIPVTKAASAYGAAGSGNIISQIIQLVVAFFTWLMGLVGLGGRGGPATQDDADQALDRSPVRGFQNPDDRRRDQQLYNGNSLNFEPRAEEDDK